jgi:NADH-quinone oxidoreductase subunit F
MPIDGSEHTYQLDSLIVAIGEDSGVDCVGPAKSSMIETTQWNTVKVDDRTLLTNRPGVFAAGDVVSGPNTVVEAIAAGKRAAVMIRRFLLKEDMAAPLEDLRRPKVYVEPLPSAEVDEEVDNTRVKTPRASVEWRKRNFAEVEVSLSADEARREASRCLRCDLEFTKPATEAPEETPALVTEGEKA